MERMVQYKPDPVNLRDLLELAIAECAVTMTPPTIELRRNPSQAHDAAILVAGTKRTNRASSRQLFELLSDRPEFTSVRQRRERITLRFSDELVASIGPGLQAGRPGGIDASSLLSGSSFVVDFCDPNATKALHIGHLRNIAIGAALAAMIETSGGRVARQSVICDIGRNVCEALAGYLQSYCGLTPESEGLKPDVFVGKCYSEYVKQGGVNGWSLHSNGPDAPIEREITEHQDLANQLEQKWLANDRSTIQLWRRVRSWALEGQAATLERLGIEFDRVLFESDSFETLESVLREGVHLNLFVRTESGVIVYPTGRPDYPYVPLVRSDGFPTEHMRALLLWRKLQMEDPVPTACIHVMGDEWLQSTELRAAILRQLMYCPLFSVYEKVPHGMVRLDGSKMKSSTGHALLADDLIDELKRSAQVTELCSGSNLSDTAPQIAKIVTMCYFLSQKPEKDIEFSMAKICDAAFNPGWTLARAWSQAARVTLADSGEDAPLDPGYRFVAVQSQFYRRALHTSIMTLDPSLLVRYLSRIATWYLAEPRSSSARRVVFALVNDGLRSLGMISSPSNPS